MPINIPPVVPFGVGALLVVLGILRVRYLAAPRVPPVSDRHGEREGEGVAEAPAKPVRDKQQKRHLRMGLLWVAMGLFLVVSTYLQIRRQG